MSIQRERIKLWQKAWDEKYNETGYGYGFVSAHEYSTDVIAGILKIVHSLKSDDSRFLYGSYRRKISSILTFLQLSESAIINNFQSSFGFNFEFHSDDEVQGAEYLPSSRGVYMFTMRQDINDSNGQSFCVDIPLYIGKTTNLSQRFINHHRLDEIKFLHDMGHGIDFYYLTDSEYFNIADLGKFENLLIEMLLPLLNGTRYLSSNKNGIIPLQTSQYLMPTLINA